MKGHAMDTPDERSLIEGGDQDQDAGRIAWHGPGAGHAGIFAEAETHFRAALAETEKAELFPGSGFWCSTSMWLARFYVARQRYSEAAPLFQKALEIPEEDRGPTSYLPHHIQEFAKLYEAWGKYEAAEVLYRRAAEVSEQLLTTVLRLNPNIRPD